MKVWAVRAAYVAVKGRQTEKEGEKMWGVRDAVTTGQYGEPCETVLHKSHSYSPAGECEIVSAGDAGRRCSFGSPYLAVLCKGSAPMSMFVVPGFSEHGKDERMHIYCIQVHLCVSSFFV